MNRRRLMLAKHGGVTPVSWDVEWDCSNGSIQNYNLQIATDGNGRYETNSDNSITLYSGNAWYAPAFIICNPALTNKTICIIECDVNITAIGQASGGPFITAKTTSGVYQYYRRTTGRQKIKLERTGARNKLFINDELILENAETTTIRNGIQDRIALGCHTGGNLRVFSVRIKTEDNQ